MIEKVTAPFTAEQVLSLNGFQTAGLMHPFICGEEGCRSVLVAVEWGWVCPRLGCEYTQDWAHSFMADGSWRQALNAGDSASCKPYNRSSSSRIGRSTGEAEEVGLRNLPPHLWLRELSTLVRETCWNERRQPVYACDGPAGEKRRIRISELVGVFQHNPANHPGEGDHHA